MIKNIAFFYLLDIKSVHFISVYNNHFIIFPIKYQLTKYWWGVWWIFSFCEKKNEHKKMPLMQLKKKSLKIQPNLQNILLDVFSPELFSLCEQETDNLHDFDAEKSRSSSSKTN